MTLEVDPFEAVIALAQRDGDLRHETNEGQIDLWHHYGQDENDWPLNSKSLTLTPVPGVPPQLHDRVQRLAFEARCYGNTPYDAGQVYMKLGHWLRTAERQVVEVTGGKALVYYVVPTTSPRFGMEEKLRPGGGMPYYAVPLKAEVSELFVV